RPHWRVDTERKTERERRKKRKKAH
uniref:ATPase 13A5 n=1 Tax=Otolemur garnettii TaxID=30611 RepID=H0XRC1_OTOGA